MLGLSIQETMQSKMGLIYDMFDIYKIQNGMNKVEEV